MLTQNNSRPCLSPLCSRVTANLAGVCRKCLDRRDREERAAQRLRDGFVELLDQLAVGKVVRDELPVLQPHDRDR